MGNYATGKRKFKRAGVVDRVAFKANCLEVKLPSER
jgi:hypothetical protein